LGGQPGRWQLLGYLFLFPPSIKRFGRNLRFFDPVSGRLVDWCVVRPVRRWIGLLVDRSIGLLVCSSAGPSGHRSTGLPVYRSAGLLVC